jgi:hypothetical protein
MIGHIYLVNVLKGSDCIYKEKHDHLHHRVPHQPAGKLYSMLDNTHWFYDHCTVGLMTIALN